jgi:hypothetical protein
MVDNLIIIVRYVTISISIIIASFVSMIIFLLFDYFIKKYKKKKLF